MTLLQFCMTFVLLLFIGSFFILGWKNITEGHWSVWPNDKPVAMGKLFKHFSLFIEKEVGEITIRYCGKQLEIKLRMLESMRPDLAKKLSYKIGEDGISIPEFISDEDITQMEGAMSCRILVNSDPQSEVPELILFQVYPKYLFPEWIRNPVISCVECMPSVYGTLIWIAVNRLEADLWMWTDHPFDAKFVFWIIFIVSLSWINKFLNRKTK